MLFAACLFDNRVLLLLVLVLLLISMLPLFVDKLELFARVTFPCLVNCRTVGAILSTRGAGCLELMLLMCRPVPIDRRLCTPLSGLITCRLTVGSLLGPMTAIGSLFARKCVVLLGGPIAVDSLTCRRRGLPLELLEIPDLLLPWLTVLCSCDLVIRPLNCLRSNVRRELCPALVIVRTLLMTIALMALRTCLVPEASSRQSDLGAAIRTLGGREVTC